MADVKEQDMKDSADIVKMRGLDSAGNSILMSMAQVADKMRPATVDNPGLMSADNVKNYFGSKGQIGSNIPNLDDLIGNGIYYISGFVPTNSPFSFCQLIVFSVGFTCVQIGISSAGDIKIRINWAKWSNWMSIS